MAAKTQNNGLMSIAGGGDTIAALANAGVSDQFLTYPPLVVPFWNGLRVNGCRVLRHSGEQFFVNGRDGEAKRTDTMFLKILLRHAFQRLMKH